MVYAVAHRSSPPSIGARSPASVPTEEPCSKWPSPPSPWTATVIGTARTPSSSESRPAQGRPHAHRLHSGGAGGLTAASLYRPGRGPWMWSSMLCYVLKGYRAGVVKQLCADWFNALVRTRKLQFLKHSLSWSHKHVFHSLSVRGILYGGHLHRNTPFLSACLAFI